MGRTARSSSWLVSVCATVLVCASFARGAEVSTDLAALLSGAGKVALATEGTPQWGVEVYLAGSGQQLQWGLDVWGRVYRGAKWMGLAVGWRRLEESFAVASAQAGYRFTLAPDVFLDTGVGLQVRSNGFVGFVPRIYFGWRW